jgi:alkylation response protein AidB-like acyl-CoA dehydrogenase
MVDSVLGHWLDAHAQALDLGQCDPESVLPQLADAGVMRVGIGQEHGGLGGTLADAVETVATIATHSVTAAFVFWGQRAFIEYLLHSPNARLRETLLPALLDGSLAGATGLSNAMKFLSGIETLQVRGIENPDGWSLEGRLHWVTNLRKQSFVVAAAIEGEAGNKPFVMAILSTASGLRRSEDLQLMGLQSSNTAALEFNDIELSRDWLLHPDAKQFLPAVRPGFLGLQCGLSIGLARRSLDEVKGHLDGTRSVLSAEHHEQVERLESVISGLKAGLLDGRFMTQAAALFRLRIALAQSVASAVQLELQASGGKAFLDEHGSAFARRWRESAFIPIVTPSLVQLQAELQRQARESAA